VNSTYRSIKSDRVNLVAPASPVHRARPAFLPLPGGTVQTETRKVDPARKFKCTPAARVLHIHIHYGLVFVCLFVCLLVSNKHHFFGATQMTPGTVKIEKFPLQKMSDIFPENTPI